MAGETTEQQLGEARQALAEAIEQLEGWINWKCPRRHVAEHTANLARLRALGGIAGGVQIEHSHAGNPLQFTRCKFDLEDGHPPVTFVLSHVDGARFVSFMAGYDAAAEALRHIAKFDLGGIGAIGESLVKTAICKIGVE